MNEPTSLTAVAVLNISPTAVNGRLTVEGIDSRSVRSELELLSALESLRDLVLERACARQAAAAA